MGTPGTEAARTFARGRGDYDRFFDLSLDLLTTVGFDGRFKRVNPSWERTLDWTEAELLARPYLEVIHPNDRARTAGEAQRLAPAGIDERQCSHAFVAELTPCIA